MNLTDAIKDQIVKGPLAPNQQFQRLIQAVETVAKVLDSACKFEPNLMLMVLANLAGRVLSGTGVDPDTAGPAQISWFETVREVRRRNGGGGLVIPAARMPPAGGKR